LVINGVAITAGDRIFAAIARIDFGPRFVKVRNGAPVPYPDAVWHAWSGGADTAHALV